MPIYEYRCSTCDRSFEALVRTGDALARCPHCDGSALTREMSTFAARAGTDGGVAAAAQAIAGSGISRRYYRRWMLRRRVRLPLTLAIQLLIS